MKKAFTLIELIVVIAIIAILALIMIPQVVSYLDNSKMATCNENTRIIEQEYVHKLLDGNASSNLVNDVFTSFDYNKVSDGIYQSNVSDKINISTEISNDMLVTACYFIADGYQVPTTTKALEGFEESMEKLIDDDNISWITGDKLNEKYEELNTIFEIFDKTLLNTIYDNYDKLPDDLFWKADTNNNMKSIEEISNRYIMFATDSTNEWSGYLAYYNGNYYKPKSDKISYHSYTKVANKVQIGLSNTRFSSVSAVEYYLDTKGWEVFDPFEN